MENEHSRTIRRSRTIRGTAPTTARRPTTARGARRAVLCGAAVLAAGMVLSACGSGDDGAGSGQKSSDSGVASLQSPSAGGAPGASAQSSKAAIDAKRPQLRLDTSPKERDRLTDVYNACLQAHGVPMNNKRANAAGAKQAPPMQGSSISKDHKAAFDACLVKLPLQPVEQRPETNPHYADDYRDYVSCLNSKGMKIHQTFTSDGSPDGWAFDTSEGNGLSDAQQEKFDHDCTLKAFGGK